MIRLQRLGTTNPASKSLSEPIRVLEFRCADGPGGGPEKTILHGAACADRRRVAVTVCYLRKQDDPAFDIDRRAAQLGVDYVEIRQRGPLDPAVFAALRQLIRQQRIDIVHAHDYKTDLLTLLLARCEGIIPLSTAHGWTGSSWRERRLYYPIDRRLLACFPLVIAVSKQIRDELVRAGARPDQVRTVLNGIEPDVFRRDPGRVADARACLGLRLGEVAIGAIGRLSRQKRFDLLLRAFAALHARRPNLRLVIAGDGEQRETLIKLAAGLRLTGICQFVGHVPDIIGLHHGLDLVVQSSDYEGTPNVVLEAMAMQTPLVATAVGGTAELVRDGIDGLLVPRRDVAALVRAVEQILDQPEQTARRIQAARQRVERELSFAARTRTVQGLYEELVRLHQPGNLQCRSTRLAAPHIHAA